MNFTCSTISQAIINNDVDSFKVLLNKRKRIDIPDNLGYTSLHIAAKKTDINPIIIDTLLNHPDVEINARTVEGFTSLFVAINKTLNIETIKKLLQHDADPCVGNMEDVTPLHQAVKYGHFELVELLIKYKSNINAKDFNSYTPLHVSIEHNHKKITKYLLAQGADADLPELNGLNPLMFAIENQCSYAHILIAHTKQLNQKTNDNMSALQLSIKRNNLRVTELLARNGHDLYLGENESLPLLQALKQVNFPIYKLIWETIEPKRLKKYDEIFRKILIGCNVACDFRFLEIVINDPRLETDISRSGILAFIFYKGTNLNLIYTEGYFRNSQQVFEKFFECLIRQGIRLSSADVESFIFYFHTCPYRINLLQRLLATEPDITEHLVIYAFEYDLKLGVMLLQHCLDVYPDNLFDHFRHISRKQVDVWEILIFLLRLFTPCYAHRVQLVEKLAISPDEQNADVYRLLNYRKNVKSLREISRNAVRERFQDVCDTSAEFLRRVEQLDVPVVIKDYIRLKLTVRSP